MNYTYMVKCADGTLYTGWTNCVEKRLKAHNEGKAGAKYTRAKRPVELVYYEGYATKEEAMRREYAIKQLTRKEKLKLMEFWKKYPASDWQGRYKAIHYNKVAGTSKHNKYMKDFMRAEIFVTCIK